MVKVEAALGAEPDAVRRLGALGVWVAEDAERLTQRLRLSNAESERLLALEHWWRVAPQAGEQAARALLYRLGPQSFTDRVLLAWARSEAGAPTTPGARWRACRNAGPRRLFRSRRPISSAAALPRARARRRAARRRSGLDRGGFSGGRSARIDGGCRPARRRTRSASRSTNERIVDLRAGSSPCVAEQHWPMTISARAASAAAGAPPAQAVSRGRISAIMPRGRMRSTCISLPRQTNSLPRSALTNSAGNSRSRTRQ